MQRKFCKGIVLYQKEHMKIPKEKTVRVTAIPVNPKEVILLEKRVLHRVHTIHTAILIHPGETIPMMFIIMMIRMILPVNGKTNLMMDMTRLMIIGKRNMSESKFLSLFFWNRRTNECIVA